MKKLTLLFLSFLVTVSLSAQDGKKLLKEAKKELATYTGNVAANQANLDNAIKLMADAFKDETLKEDADALLAKGDFYNEIIDANLKASLINPSHKHAMPEAALMAVDAYEMALAKAIKKNQTKSALKGLSISETNLYNTGAVLYDAKEYGGSFDNFVGAIKAAELLKSAGEKSRIDDTALKNELYYFTVIAGSLSDKGAGIEPYAKFLYDAGTDKAYVYQVLHEMQLTAGNDELASKYITEGRAKFPEDTGLLFAEINYALKQGKLSELIEKLKIASTLEPDNLGIINTLGSVNEQLAKKSVDAGDEAKAEEYNQEALKYYTMVMEKDPTNFDAPYNIGAFYYNKAAKMAAQVNELAQDYSAAGTKKYNAAKGDMNALFEKALPYFIKGESLNDKDLNIVIALREIYVRLGQIDKSNTYKAKYEELTQK